MGLMYGPVTTPHLTLTAFPCEGGIKYYPESFAPVDRPQMDTASPSDSDSLADTDSDCTLKIVEPIDSPSSWCYSAHDCDNKPTDAGAPGPEKPPPLVDSHVFVFRTNSRAQHLRTDDLDFWCAGEDRKPLRRGSLPYGSRSLRYVARTRPRSMPCGISLIHESHSSRFGTGTPVKHIFIRSTRPPRPPRSDITASDDMITIGVEAHPSNKWGNNPPAGYI